MAAFSFANTTSSAKASITNVSTVDFSKFHPEKFEDYHRLCHLVEKLNKGRIVRYTLQGYNVCSALITRLEEDLDFRHYFINKMVTIIENYESQFPEAKDLAYLVDEFQKQAWTLTPPTLFFTLLFVTDDCASIPNFNDPETVKKLETCYNFLVTGQYSELMRHYSSKVKSDFDFNSYYENFDQGNIDFLRPRIDTFFVDSQRSQDIPQTFFRQVLQQGEYEIFLMFFAEAVHRKDELVIDYGCQTVMETRNLDLAKTVFDPVNGYYSMADSELKLSFHVDYYHTSKAIYDYCSKLWPYNQSQPCREFDIEETVADGDYQMFRVNVVHFRKPDYRELIEVAGSSGSIEIYQELESALAAEGKLYDYDAVVYFCFSDNCIDLALYLINHSHKRELFRQIFVTRIENNKKDNGERKYERQYMIRLLEL